VQLHAISLHHQDVRCSVTELSQKIRTALRTTWPGIADRDLLSDPRFTGETFLREAILLLGLQQMTRVIVKLLPVPQKPEERLLRVVVHPDDILQEGDITEIGWLTTERQQIVRQESRPDLGHGAQVMSLQNVAGPMLDATSIIRVSLSWKGAPEFVNMVQQQFGLDSADMIPAAFPDDLVRDLTRAFMEDLKNGKAAFWGFKVYSSDGGEVILGLK